MAKTRRSDSPEYKREAARLVVERGLTRSQVADDLVICRSLVGTCLSNSPRNRARKPSRSRHSRAGRTHVRRERPPSSNRNFTRRSSPCPTPNTADA